MSSTITFQVKLSDKIDIEQTKLKLHNLKKKGFSVDTIHDGENVLLARIAYPKKLDELEKKLTDINRRKANAKDEILLKTYDDLIKSIKAEINVLEGGIEISINQDQDQSFKILKNSKQDEAEDIDIFKHYLEVYTKEIISNLFGNIKDLQVVL